jgi:hypothetical protein
MALESIEQMGLFYHGIVTAVPGANQFTIPALAGLGAGKLSDATAPYQAFVLRQAGGAGAAPQGEIQDITGYVTGTGVFTTNAFTVAVGIGDEVLILHPSLAGTIGVLAAVGDPADLPEYTITAIDSLMSYLKAVHGAKIVATGVADAGSDFDSLVDAARLEANNYWDGLTLLMLTGNNAGITRPISEYMLGVSIDVRPAYPAAIAAGDVYVILSDYHASIRSLFVMDFWSSPQEEVQLTDVAAPGTDVALPDVTIADLPAGATIVRAIAMFKFRMVENTNAGANALQGNQYIQVRDDTPGTWRDSILMIDDMFTLAASTREGGDVIIGAVDIAVEVDGNDTYNFQWAESLIDLANLQFNDCQVGLRIWYSV